jgi:hypothetical protein
LDHPSGDVDDGTIHTDNCEAFIDFICTYLHGISRKYVQIHLASFWCYKDRKRWGSGAVLKACFQSHGIDDEEILAYVSPPMVKVPA